MKNLDMLNYSLIAHRGFHNNSVKENSKEAIILSCENNYMIEIVFHDDNLKRLYNIDKNIYELDINELNKLTNSEVITLQDALSIIDDRVPVIIEIKKDDKTYKLENNIVRILDNYKGRFSVKSFSYKSMLWFKKHRNNYIRGLLLSNRVPNMFILKYFIWRVKPDFLSVHYKLLYKKYFKDISKHIKVLSWTIKDKDTYIKVKDKCDNLICENISGFGEG